MKVKDVLQCSFQNWYTKFEDSTISSLILPIPPDALSYLQENGTLVIPEGSCGVPIDMEDSLESWDEDSETNDVATATAPNLDEFNQKIRNAIKRLGGTIFPKLNWSSPKDASWISFNKSLQCSNPGDVYLLLKSSDFVSHDLTSPFKDCDDQDGREEKINYNLILRKWIEINPSDEFRCFVKDRELIGISQRDISQYYSSIHKEKDCILDDILIFWEENIRNYFPSLSYVFDVHRPRDGEVSLIDFGPFGPTTDSLMFTWEELSSTNQANDSLTIPYGLDSNRLQEDTQEQAVDTQFRYISHATGVQPSPYMRYGLPVDIVDLSTGQDPAKLTDFLQMKIQTEGDDADSSEEDVCSDESSLTTSSL